MDLSYLQILEETIHTKRSGRRRQQQQWLMFQPWLLQQYTYTCSISTLLVVICLSAVTHQAIIIVQQHSF